MEYRNAKYMMHTPTITPAMSDSPDQLDQSKIDQRIYIKSSRKLTQENVVD